MIKIKNKEQTPDEVILSLLEYNLENDTWDKLEVPFWGQEYIDKAVALVKEKGYSYHKQSLENYTVIHIYE